MHHYGLVAHQTFGQVIAGNLGVIMITAFHFEEILLLFVLSLCPFNWDTWNWAVVAVIKSTYVFPAVTSQYVCCATSLLWQCWAVAVLYRTLVCLQLYITKSKQHLLFVMLLTPPPLHTDQAREHQNTAEQQHAVFEWGEGGRFHYTLLNIYYVFLSQAVKAWMAEWN